jgi:hypothetical protein
MQVQTDTPTTSRRAIPGKLMARAYRAYVRALPWNAIPAQPSSYDSAIEGDLLVLRNSHGVLHVFEYRNDRLRTVPFESLEQTADGFEYRGQSIAAEA